MRKYKFDIEIEIKLAAFKTKLKAKGYDENTVRQHKNYTGIYLEWIREEGIEIKEVRYQDVIEFILDLQNKNNNSRFINRIVLAVRHYYNYLDVPKNPASGIYIRGRVSKVPVDIVRYPEVTSLYERYQGLDNRTKRNKVMLGLIVYQAVTTRALHRLEPQHIKLKEGKIYVPGTSSSLARVLAIKTNQLLELQEYLEEIRPKMISSIREENRRVLIDRLFFSERGNGDIKSSLYHMFRQIKKMNPSIKSGSVIRQSVITEWTKTIGIRQVQYMAGYKCVGSVERYRNYNMEALAEALKEYHPLQ